MNSVLDIPLSITEQLDSPTLYWNPGISNDPTGVPDENKFTLSVLASEVDALIAQNQCLGRPGFAIIREPYAMTYDEVNECARKGGCLDVRVFGDLKSGNPKIVDSWKVPCE